MYCNNSNNGFNRIYRALVPFGGFIPSTPVIPEQYWNAYSIEQKFKWLACTLESLIRWVNSGIIDNVNEVAAAIGELKDEFEKFKESGFDDYYAEQVAKWIDEHLSFIFEHTVKQVFFGLTSDGRFCAYIPDSWSDIEFDTGMIYGQFDYGRLILRYNVEGSGVIDNTGRYDELNSNLVQVMGTLYAPMSEGGDV